MSQSSIVSSQNNGDKMEMDDNLNGSFTDHFKQENISNLSLNSNGSFAASQLVHSTPTIDRVLLPIEVQDVPPNEDLSNLNEDTITAIARSAFADMLWDQERNYLYKKAIKKALTQLLANKLDDQANLLDIGAGTGLLSMFMYRALNEFLNDHPKLNKGNKRIVALEQFFYSYLSGKEIIRLNGMDDRINLIYKNSLTEKLENGEFLMSSVQYVCY